jgi:hypothetical protein
MCLVCAVCATGCGSEKAEPEGGEDANECDLLEVCGAIPLEHVNMLCGLSTTTFTSTSRLSADPEQLPTVNGCDYNGDPAGQVEHDCFESASLASFYFTNEKDNPPSSETQTDVTGVGDEAFLREDSLLSSSKLYALKANLLVVTTAGWSGGGQTTAADCVKTLAAEALAL